MHEIKYFCDVCGKQIELQHKDSFEIKFGHSVFGGTELELCVDCGQKHIDYLNSIKKNNPDSK